jgi:hypothetical protein
VHRGRNRFIDSGLGFRATASRRRGLDVANHPQVEAQGRDHLLAILELEEALDRLPVSGRCRHVDEATGVGHAEVREEDTSGASAA